MNYKKAIDLLKNNDNAGFEFLYNNTYRDKYYLALKYMKNEEDAMDVMQESYLKAIEKIDTLDDPEKFPKWFSMIVANTAKNALKKKYPVLFSQMVSENDDGDLFEYQLEDESITFQPERAYSDKETQEMVQELISSLSEEQRMCIIMFHFDGLSIKEIAQALGCSENTVKSRLNYGRKNIKSKAEELQKKGYKLYGLAPLPLLLYLMWLEKSKFNPNIPPMNPSATKPLASNTAKAASKSAKTFFNTTAGKITAAVIAVTAAAAIAVGTISAVSVKKNSKNNDTNTPQTSLTQQADEEISVDAVLDAYQRYVDDNKLESKYKFIIIFADNDNIPEVLAVDDSAMNAEDMYSYKDCNIKLLSYYNNDVTEFELPYGDIHYIDKSGKIYDRRVFAQDASEDVTDLILDFKEDIIYELKDGQLKTASSGYGDPIEWINPDTNEIKYSYKWNDSEVSEQEYNKSLDNSFDTDKSIFLNEVLFDTYPEARKHMNDDYTEVDSAFKAYQKYIDDNEDMFNDCQYDLVYIDNNNIPELCAVYQNIDGVRQDRSYVLTYSNGKVDSVGGVSVYYIAGKSKICVGLNPSGEAVYEIKNGKFSKIGEGGFMWSDDDKPYEWNGEKYTSDEYEEIFKKNFDQKASDLAEGNYGTLDDARKNLIFN